MKSKKKQIEQSSYKLKELSESKEYTYKDIYSRYDNYINWESDCHRSDNDPKAKGEIESEKLKKKFKPHMKWPELSGLLFVHLGCLYGIYLLIHTRSLRTFIWLFLSIYISGLGITAGVHRLWSHRAYKANYPLQFILLILFTISGQRDVYAWVLDHRVHHKYSETNADPHNAKRGFIFSHIGWLVLTPHPEVLEKRARADMSDLEANPLIMWHKKYYVPLFLVFAVALPVVMPWFWWNECLWNSFWINFNTRYCITLNIAFFVNSVAHFWGRRPYDKNINPADNLSVSIAALGEGWHNYHHVFPFDYKTGELGDYTFNLTTGFIDFFAKIGWASNRKSASKVMVERRKARTGEGNSLWGWGDKDMSSEDYKELNNQF